MCYSALEHLLCQANDRTIEQGTVLKGFRNESHFTKRRKRYRMLPINEKRVEFMQSYSGLHVRHYTEHTLASYHNKVAAI